MNPVKQRKSGDNRADAERLGYVGKRPGIRRDSDSWFTPAQYLDAVRAVLGRIDLDPFSSEAANLSVRAKRYYTESDDALDRKSTRLNSSHVAISYAVFCLKKKKKQ